MKGIGYSEVSTEVQKILNHKLKVGLEEISDEYNLPKDEIENLMLSLFVKDASKVLWKSTKTLFVKIYDKELDRIIEEEKLNDRQLGALLRLSRYIRYEDNIIRNPDGSYMSQQEMVEHLKLSKSTVNELLRVFKANQLIFTKPNPDKKNQTVYYLSPEIFYKGQYIHRKIKDSLLRLTDMIKQELINKNIQTVEDTLLLYDDLFVQTALDEFIDNVVGCDIA